MVPGADLVAVDSVDAAIEAHRVLVRLAIHLVDIVQAAVGSLIGGTVRVLV